MAKMESYCCDFSIVVELKEEDSFHGETDVPNVMEVVENEGRNDLISCHRESRHCIIDGDAKNIEDSRS